MNDYVNRKFELIKRTIDHLRNPYQRDKIRVQVEEFFDSIADESQKKDIINYFKAKLDEGLAHHKEICTASDGDCVIEKNYEATYFFLDQELKKAEKENASAFKNYIQNLTINGTGNIVNIGGVNGDIVNNISILKDKGEEDIAGAFERLTEVINNESPVEQRELLLDNINTLSNQATLEKSDRLPINVIKTIFSGINILSSISTVAGVDLKSIFSYFIQ